MRVLHVIPSVSAIRGGPSTVLRTIAETLVIKGIEVDVATTNDNGRGLLDCPLGSPVMMHGVRYWFFARDFRFYTVSWALGRWLSQHSSDYDLIHIHALFSFSSVVAAHYALRYRVPYIVRPLGTLNRWGIQHRRPWLKKLSLRLLERRILQGAATIHFTSEQEKREAMDVVSFRHWMVLPNPVNEESVFGKLPPGWLRTRYPSIGARKVILFFSRLDPKKGLKLLLEAFALLREEQDDIVLVLSGDGESTFVASLKKTVAALGIEDSVFWTGFLSGPEKYAAFQDAHMFVLPSYSENFGVSVVEAMSQGLPTIVSDQVALHQEIAEAGAGLVVPCAVSELKQAMRTFCTETELREAASRQCKSLAARFLPATVGDRMLSVYLQLANGRTEIGERLPC